MQPAPEPARGQNEKGCARHERPCGQRERGEPEKMSKGRERREKDGGENAQKLRCDEGAVEGAAAHVEGVEQFQKGER